MYLDKVHSLTKADVCLLPVSSRNCITHSQGLETTASKITSHATLLYEVFAPKKLVTMAFEVTLAIFDTVPLITLLVKYKKEIS